MKEQLKLTEQDKLKIRSSKTKARVDLSVGSFFVNGFDESRYINEAIAEKVAKVFEIQCAEYFLVDVGRTKRTLAVISKDLNVNDDFHPISFYWDKSDTTADLSTICDISLYKAWHIIENLPFGSYQMVIELVKVYIFDLLLANCDRHYDNWGIRKNHIAILDNDLILTKSSRRIKLPSTYGSLDIPFFTEDFEVFLKTSSSEFIDLFLYYFRLITPAFLANLLLEIEQEEGIEIPNKEEILALYLNYRRALGEIYFNFSKTDALKR